MTGKTQSGTLLWRQLFRQSDPPGGRLQARFREMLMHAIGERILEPGDALPSSRWFAQTLGISRTTVSLVLDRLRDSGTLESRPRSGYRVNPEFSGVRVRTGTVGPAPRPPASPAWVRRVHPQFSRLRNIDKPRNWQRYPFPFIYGQFDPSLFPFAQWRECALESLHKGAVADWAPDHIDQDSKLLVDEIQKRLLPARGILVERDNILVTSGAQQATYLLARLLVTKDVTVGIENPGYPDARNSFALHGRSIKALPVDDQGLLIDRGVDECRYIYVTPSHQCPTTVTMTMARRAALLSRAEQSDIVVIEDDHESELNHSGRPNPALKSLDTNGRVVYIGSLSKTLAHGLRLGYVVAPRELIAELRILRRLMIRHPATNNEYAAGLFIRHGYHEDHVRRLNKQYRERAAVLRDALSRYLPDASYAQANGGSALWVALPDGTDATALAGKALERGIIIEPGSVFFAGRRAPRHYIRMGYSSIEARRIPEGVQALSALLRHRG